MKDPEDCHKLIIDPGGGSCGSARFSSGFMKKVPLNDGYCFLNEGGYPFARKSIKCRPGEITHQALAGKWLLRPGRFLKILQEDKYTGDMVHGAEPKPFFIGRCPSEKTLIVVTWHHEPIVFHQRDF